MSFPIQSKAQFPVYAGDDMAPVMSSTMPKSPSKTRRLVTEVFATVLVCVMVGCAWSMYSIATDRSYAKDNNLMVEYKALLRQRTPALGRRAVESDSAPFITTTTTVTKGTTITAEVTAPWSVSSSSATSSSATSSSATSSSATSSAFSSSAPLTFTSFPPVQNTTMSTSANATKSASAACGTPSTETITVTVTAEHSPSVISDTPFVSFSIFSSIEPTTVIETRLTTATITVTAGHHTTPVPATQTLTATAIDGHTSTKIITVTGHHTTPAPATQTLTATAIDGHTSTKIITVHPGGGNHTLTGTSTSTADAVFGAGSHTLRYPNSTISLTPYGTPVNGGGEASTASYTVTLPGGHTGGTLRATTPVYTSTSAADPVGTIVTVSGASKTGSAFAIAAAVAAAVAAFTSLF